MITVVGCGYVGLVTGTCLAELGQEVACVDQDEQRIRQLRAGECPIYEEQLKGMIQRNRAAGRLSFFSDLHAIPDSGVIFLCVGTPSNPDGSVDLSYLLDAAGGVARALAEGQKAIVVVKSTVPPGTWRAVVKILSESAPTVAECYVVSNPEFLKEGRAVDDFMRPERVVVGAGDPTPHLVMRALYEPLLRNVGRYFETDNATAEISKYATNAMLAARVSFMNEMALICDEVGADVDDVRQVLGADSRIGPKFLFPGPGWGGSCWGKDLQGLIRTGEECGVPPILAHAALRANEAQRMAVWDRLEAAIGKASSRHPRIALWGLSFKPGTDDVRDSTAVWLTKQLDWRGAGIAGYDPEAGENFLQAVDAADAATYADPYEAIRDADALVLLTEWPCFKVPDFARIRELMKGRYIFDTRNLWDPKTVRSYGLHYEGMGRGRDRGRWI